MAAAGLASWSEPPELSPLDRARVALEQLRAQSGSETEVLKWIEQESAQIQTEIESLEQEIATLSGNLPAPSNPPLRIDFNRDIRPILSTRCFTCHGPDPAQRKAGLRLDEREGLFSPLKSGALPVVPGDRLKSTLYQRIRTHDEADRMPPISSKKTLTEKEIETLGQWIDQGAEFEEHWAFLPLARPEVPSAESGWARNDVDRFILSTLSQEGMEPNPEADRRKLIRRVTLDFTGLLPTVEEVESFVQDESSDAFEKVVDRLLASSHYGERWARHWLDVARFAESHGYEQDYDRKYAYHYRDFVIQAFNEDLPYDDFVKWQLAGDEIAPENPLAMMATGFLAAGVHSTQITMSQVEKERYDELDDMARTTGTAFLGLTIGCARCHDHKFDPIPASDYYRLLSTFTTTVRSDIEVSAGEDAYLREKARWETERKPLVEVLETFERDHLPAKFSEWLAANPDPQRKPDWIPLNPSGLNATSGAAFTQLPEDAVLVSGATGESETYTFTAFTAAPALTAIRLEALPHQSLSGKGPGRAANGNFALSEIAVTVEPMAGGDPVSVTLTSPEATYSQDVFPVAGAIDGDPQTAWAVDGRIGQEHSALFEFANPVAADGGAIVRIVMKFNVNTVHALGHFRLSVSGTSAPLAIGPEGAPPEIFDLLSRKKSEPDWTPNEDETAKLMDWYKQRDGDWKSRNQRIVDLDKTAPKPDGVRVLVASEGVDPVRNHSQGEDFLKETHFLTRGDPNQKEGVATQSFLAVLMDAPSKEAHWQEAPPEGWKTSYRRRALANWITDVDKGAGRLLARVIVNRLWQHHFGRGIVATPSDFGYQAAPPSHPELLEFLAAELVANGWKLKPIHRLMVTSAAYRQSAQADPVKVKLDPENKWVARFEGRRLEGEIIRDVMLQTSGMLDTTPFGPGTLDPLQLRRSIYFTVKRSRLVSMMMLFDCPDSLQSIANRPATTIAPQALVLMNNELARGAARSFADRILGEGSGTPEDRVRTGYLIALGRQPDAKELAESLAFLAAQRDDYKNEGKPDAEELALADFCHVLLCLNEFVYLD